MKNISEFDERQLKLMRKVLISFEKKQIELSALVGCLEFLLSALESVDEDWEERFINEITTLETINDLEIIEDSKGGVPVIEGDEQGKLINESVFNLKEIIESELRQLVKKIDEMNMRNLSFPDFEMEKMEFSPEKKTLKIFMKSVWLEENDEKRLGKGILFFNNWESISVNKLDPVTKAWVMVENIYPEHLKYLFEFKIFNSSICLYGFGKKSQLEWKIINTQMHAEFTLDTEWKMD